MKKKQYETLEKAFVKKILPFVIIASVSLITLSQANNMRTEYRSFTAKTELQTQRLVFDFTDPIWNLDSAQIDNVGNVIIRDPDIAGISIFSDNHRLIDSMGICEGLEKNEIEKWISSHRADRKAGMTSLSFVRTLFLLSSRQIHYYATASPIYYNSGGEELLIGTVILIMTDQYLTARIRKDFYTLLILALLVFSIITVSVLTSHHSIVTRPLRELSKALSRATADMDLPEFKEPDGLNEIEDLRNLFNLLWKNQRKLSNSLEESEEFLRESASIARVGGWEINRDEDRVYWTDELSDFHGHSSGLTPRITSIPDYFHPDDSAAVSDALEGVLERGVSFELEARLITAAGDSLWVNLKGKALLEGERVIGARGTVQDITQRKKSEKEKQELQRQVNHMNKIDLLGQLAGGIAHDFNNILTPIIGYVEIAMQQLPEGSREQDYLDKVLLASRRAGELVQQILTFSRDSELERKPLEAQIVIKEAMKLFRSSLPSSIGIEQDIKGDCPAILADPVHIHQIVMNLCTNAFHSMEKEGGVISISYDRADHFPAPPERKSLCSDSHVCLMVRDTGHGMSRDVLDRIFEPYYTTKDKSRGTGLGLAITHKIISDYGGYIHVDSRLNRGSEFRIYLPLITDDGRKSIQGESASHERGRNERILLVDDEPEIVAMEQEMLRLLGYDVHSETDSLRALELFRETPHDFDLVISDITLPHLSGDRLAAEIMGIRPDIPVIMCTGYSDTFSEEDARKIGVRAYLMKPVSLKEFSRCIREALERE